MKQAGVIFHIKTAETAIAESAVFHYYSDFKKPC